jgi:hypothetical protein
MNRLYLLAALVLGSTLPACFETDVIDDAGFQIWCGDTLCAWTVEQGQVLRVPTWHEHDYAVELVGAPVVLSQQAQRSSSSCVRVELIADVEPSANMTAEIDYDGDGAIDWKRAIDREGFRSMAWDVRPGNTTASVFYLRKAAEGRAVVTQLRASSECGDP